VRYHRSLLWKIAKTNIMAGEEVDTEKLLEDYKKDLADKEKDDYDALTPEEKTAWLRCEFPFSHNLVAVLYTFCRAMSSPCCCAAKSRNCIFAMY
jgi:hypothetical protein